MKVGIIGLGIVGSAVAAGCRHCDLSILDKYRPELSQNVGKIFGTDICFVCVPTPTTEAGCNFSEIYSVLDYLKAADYKGVVTVKSTVIPGTMDLLAAAYPKLRLVHNPEFLTEKNAKADFLAQKITLLSGRADDVLDLVKFYAQYLGAQAMVSPDYQVTEWAKYIHNCVLAVKISFLNEIFDMVASQSFFNQAVEMAKPFGNVGENSKVPGPDGQRGYGGMCFPKDMAALLSFAQTRQIPVATIEGAIETNNRIRPKG